MSSDDAEHLPGNVGGATRVGRTVRRPTGPWTPAVHELLTYLAEQGLRGVPDVHGLDDEGREVLTYLEGRGVPVDREVVLENVLTEAVTWLRDFHDVVEGFHPDGPREWRGGVAELADGTGGCLRMQGKARTPSKRRSSCTRCPPPSPSVVWRFRLECSCTG